MPFAETWMDLKFIILSEVSSERESQISYHLYVGSKEMVEINLFMKRNRFTDMEHRIMVIKGRRRDKLGGWD